MNEPKATARTTEIAPRLVRAIGLLGLTAIAVNGVIGSGIFALPATVASLVGKASPAAYIVAALLIALIAACFAEAGSLFERTGGPYLYAREAFGSFLAFEVGWMFFLSRLAAAAAISNAFASYAGYFWSPLGNGIGRIATITLLVGGLTFINLIGIRYSSRAVNLLTAAKLIPLLLFIGVGLFFVDGSRYDFFALPEMNSLQQASLALIFAFGGFENATIPAEETKDPTANLPVALLIAIALTTALYILIQLVAQGTLPEIAADQTPLSSAGRIFLGSAGAAIIAIGAGLSASGSLSALALVGPRILYAFAQQGQLPSCFARVHLRYRTPHVAVIAFGIIAWAVALYGNFAALVTVSAIARLLFSATTCLAVPVLRRKMPAAPRRFKLPFGPVIPALAAIISIWLLAGITVSQAIAGAIALVAGALFYFVFQNVDRGEPNDTNV
ncbi:MAG TPA: APC family permease [Blastocatellia bacterium]|nr:APC family permease [Blastocatellia bacterium]